MVYSDEHAERRDEQPESSLGDRIREATSEAGEKLKETAARTVDRFQTVAERTLERRKQEAANRIHTVADSMRDACHALEEGNEPAASEYIELAADELDSIAAYLQDHELREMIKVTEGVARRHPGAFLCGALLCGFAAGRFLRSSSDRRDSARFDEYEPRPARHAFRDVDRAAGQGAMP